MKSIYSEMLYLGKSARIKLLLFFCFMQTGICYAQEFGFQRLSTEQGLSQNSANKIAIDHRGYMWIGTEDGLNRFDGNTVAQYRYQNEQRRIHNLAVYDILAGERDELYILGNYAIEKLSLAYDTSMLLTKLPTNHTFDKIIIDAQGKIQISSTFYQPYFANPQRTILAQFSRRFQLAFDKKADLLYTMSSDSNQILVGTLNGAVEYRIKNQEGIRLTNIFQCLPSKKILAAFINGKKRNLAIAQISEKGIRQIKTVELAEPLFDVVYQKSKERYCGVTMKGDVLLWDRDLKFIKKINAYNRETKHASTLYLHDLIVHQDNIWLAVDPQGVLYRPLGDNQFSTIEIPQQPPPVIKNLFTDSKGNLYAYVLKQGLQVFDANGKNVSSKIGLPEVLKSKKIFAGFNGLRKIAPDQFIISGNNVFGKFDAKRMLWEDYYPYLKKQIPDDLFSDQYLFFEPLEEGKALVASGSCVYEFNLDKKTVNKKHCFLAPVTQLYREKENYWIGTTRGLYQCRDKKCLTDRRFDHLIIKSIQRDSLHGLLIATSIGLYILNDSLKIINQQQGLKNSYIYGVLSDAEHNLWVSTNNGLSRINARDFSIQNFSKADGLASTEFNSYGFWKAPDERLYFSGMGGITIVDPSVSKPLVDSIPLIISALSINDRIPENLPHGSEEREFSSDENTLTFYFRDLLLPRYGGISYSYRLKNFDEHWVQTDQNAVRYPQLPPGDYSFQLKLAEGLPGILQEYHFTVALPFYKQQWFIGLCTLLLLVLIYLVGLFYQKKSLARQKALARKNAVLEEERQRIARELHDNMGAHTTALISNIQSLQRKVANAEQQKRLSRMQEDARNIMSGLRDTISILNNKKMYLTDLIDQIKMYALRLMGEDSGYTLLVNEHLSEDHLLDAPMVVHLKAILQEIIHNAIKHAEGDCITFNIKAEQAINFELGDNGRGFDENNISKGNGLENIQWRMEQIGAELDFQSNEKGTIYKFVIEGRQ